eukprot:scaffold2801_cov161-Ochromonas_danica.AAC.15
MWAFKWILGRFAEAIGVLGAGSRFYCQSKKLNKANKGNPSTCIGTGGSIIHFSCSFPVYLQR